MTENKRFIGCFKGDMLVSIKDTITNKRLNILQIVEVANKIYDENEELKEALKSKEKVIKAHENYLNTLNYLRLGDYE